MLNRLPTLCFALCCSCFLFSQNPKHIKVKKDQSTFLFFQKDSKSNVITANRTDVFYLILSDSLKNVLEIDTQNAQITPTKNDSLVLIKYLPGINYLHKFVPLEDENNAWNGANDKKNKSTSLYLKPLIDGANNREKNKIFVVFRNKQSGQTFAEFLYLVN